MTLVVIGSGPGGYTGAIRASKLGIKVVCVNQGKVLGGTCLNIGCITSKALLDFSEKYKESREHFSKIGIKTNTRLDLRKVISRKMVLFQIFAKPLPNKYT